MLHLLLNKMEQILFRAFQTDYVDTHLIKLIQEFSGCNDIEAFVQRIMKTSTNHDVLFGVKFKFTLCKSNCTVISKFSNNEIILEFRSRKFQKIRAKMDCCHDTLANFDDWVLMTQEYYNMCEQFLYYIIWKYRDGLVTCNACSKYHWNDEFETCRSCMIVYNNIPCPKCLSYFGPQPHNHI